MAKRTSIPASSLSLATVKRIKDKFDQSEQYVLDRLLPWFEQQPDELQSAILRGVPETLEPWYAKMLLERLAAGKKPKPPQEVGTGSTIGTPKRPPRGS